MLSLLWSLSAEAGAPPQIVLALELPIAARDLRVAGVPDREVTALIVGSRARHVHCDEIHATLVHTRELVVVDGPVDRWDEAYFVEYDRGIRGPDLVVWLDGYHHDHGHKHHHDEVRLSPVLGVAPVFRPGVVIVDGHRPPGHQKSHGKGKWK